MAAALKQGKLVAEVLLFALARVADALRLALDALDYARGLAEHIALGGDPDERRPNKWLKRPSRTTPEA